MEFAMIAQKSERRNRVSPTTIANSLQVAGFIFKV